MYGSYGTGEGGFTNLSGTRNGSPAFIGGGIFKSSNKGGSAFNVLSIAKDNRFQVCNTMVAHPTENKIYIGTETGLYSITDGTTLKTISNGSTKEIKIDKNGVLWASNGSGAVYKADAAGAMKIMNTKKLIKHRRQNSNCNFSRRPKLCLYFRCFR